MDSSVRRRRWSIEHPPAFSNLLKKLPEFAAAYIKVFDRKKPRMRQIMFGLEKISAQVKRMKEKSKRIRTTAVVSAAVGLVAASAAALFTGSFSLTTLRAAALSVAAAASAVGFTKKQFTRQKGQRKKVKELLKIVELLRKELEEIKRVCEDLQRQEGAETGNTAGLTDNINQLLDITAKLRTSAASDCVTDLSDHFKTAVREFEKMRRQLKEKVRTHTERYK